MGHLYNPSLIIKYFVIGPIYYLNGFCKYFNSMGRSSNQLNIIAVRSHEQEFIYLDLHLICSFCLRVYYMIYKIFYIILNFYKIKFILNNELKINYNS
jgi:hypothetical protein